MHRGRDIQYKIWLSDARSRARHSGWLPHRWTHSTSPDAFKGVGFNYAQAEAVTENVRTADLANLATRADVEATRADIERLEAKLLAQMEILRRNLTIRLGGMIVVATGVLLAAKLVG
jgi:hypothetical protein